MQRPAKGNANPKIIYRIVNVPWKRIKLISAKSSRMTVIAIKQYKNNINK